MLGIQALWKINISVEDEKVFTQAAGFLNELYQHLMSELDLKAARQEYIDTCFEILNRNNSAQEKTANNILAVKRVLSLLRHIMSESEKIGIAGLKSHGALLKGELLNLTILNNTSYYLNADQKKFPLKLYQNTTFWEFKGILGQKIKMTRD